MNVINVNVSVYKIGRVIHADRDWY